MNNDGSYPSGHTFAGFISAYILIRMVPELKTEILAQADDYAHNRLVCGVHYPSDLDVSRRVAFSTPGVCSVTHALSESSQLQLQRCGPSCI
ncbi:phosphatase PAP2 family protein [Granulicella aggregans]|uniref:phosphatase PAP2 family protein n=1 Tax=Granulicella aggregans TaxID=474949 RepID=UPI001622F9FD